MKKSKKFLCLILVMVILIPNIAIFGNVFAQTADTEPLKVEVTTDKSSYTAYGIAEITVKVTNTSDEIINNISAEAVFEQLAPVGKNNETFKEIESLQSGESFTFSYKATLNANKVNINFFEKIILWFVRLFNGGYNATSHNIEADIENTTEIKFGKYTVQNVVKIGYEDNQEEINNELNKIKDLNNGELPEIIYSEYNNIDWIHGNYHNDEIKNEADAINSLNSIRELMRINNTDIEWKCCYNSSSSNVTHYRLQQYYKGYEVDYAQWIVAVDMPNNKISHANGTVIPANYLDTNYTISVEEAENIAKNNFGSNAEISGKPELILKKSKEDDLNYKMTYKIYINGKKFPEIYYISAVTGEILYIDSLVSFERVSASGLDNNNKKRDFYSEKVTDNLYYLADFGRNISIYDAGNKDISWKLNTENDTLNVYWNNVWYQADSWFTKAEVIQNDKNEWNNKNAVTLMADLKEVYDYYYEVIEIKGYDNENSEVFAIINDNNDNDRTNAYSFAYPELKTTIISFGVDRDVTLDVVAHEYTHSVMNSKVRLEDNGESGALKEAYADIMGELIENDTTWTHGKRVISNPTINGYPCFYKGNYWGDTNSSNDRGYVHQNSTVISHAAYLMSQNGIDNETLAKIWYNSIEDLEPSSDFSDCRTAVVKAAEEYGCAQEVINIIKYCFYSVGVNDNEIWGSVVESVGASNEPLVNVTVTAQNGDYKVTGKTDANGKFTLKLPLGTYKISLSLDNYTANPSTITVDENTTNQAPYLFFMKKDDSSGGDTGLESASVHGMIVDSETQRAISNVKVTLYSEDTQATYTTVTDEIGDFNFENLTAGRYTLSFEHDDYTINGTHSFTLDEGLMFVFIEPFEFTKKDSSGEDTGDDDEEIPDPNRTVTASGDCGADGDNVKWVLYEDGELVVSGKGSMKHYTMDDYSSVPWFSCKSKIKKITIKDNITSIGGFSFFYCTNLTSVTIGNGITYIGRHAFYDCDSLTTIVFGSNLETIAECAFSDCSSLSNITLPDSLKVIENLAFDQTKLKTLTIPNGVTHIGNRAFFYCNELSSIEIPDSVIYIGQGAFENTAYHNNASNWINGVLYIDNYLIKAKTTISGDCTIKEGTIAIMDIAFQNCSNLTSIIIPDSVKYIVPYAFNNCVNLENISIPDCVISIGRDAFGSTAYYNDESNWENNVLYIGNHLIEAKEDISGAYDVQEGTKIIADNAFYYCNKLTNIIIADSVTHIGDGAFFSCDSLTNITIPDSVVKINCNAFDYCSSLRKIVVDKNNVYYSNDDNGVLFNKTKTKLIRYPEGITKTSYTVPDGVTSIGDYAFANCSRLSSITIPNGVLSIGEYAFKSCDFTSIDIPNTVTNIGSGAFYCCYELSAVTISKNITFIGDYAFSYCKSLTDVYFKGSENRWKRITFIGNNTELFNATIHYNS